jgi:hypothetical protein
MNGFRVLKARREIEADGYLHILIITAERDRERYALEA